VRLTADNQIIVLHDQTVDRTTNGSGDAAKIPLEALRELDAGSWFSDRFCNEKIPTLDEVFEMFGDRLFMNIELKNYSTPNDGLVSKVAEVIKRHKISERLWFSSFLPSNLKIAEQLLPSVPRGLLAPPLWRGTSARRDWQYGRYQSLNPFFLDTTSNLVRRIHAQGGRVFVFTVNRAIEMRRLSKIGVDGILTDDPALALRLFGRGK
jgi:glycerophosphoryl diester phosphodiesterase